MSTVLYIEASPRGKRSRSTRVAEAFLETYRGAHPDDTVARRNVFDLDLPDFDGPALDAKYAIMHGEKATEQQKNAWQRVEALISDFTSADKYVFSIPMWNFSIPYRLKQYIDVLVQPGYLFEVTAEGEYRGLVPDRPVFVAYARGGDYADPVQAEADRQKPYIELILGFIGLTDLRSVIVQPTLMQGPDTAEQKTGQAIREARNIAAEF